MSLLKPFRSILPALLPILLLITSACGEVAADGEPCEGDDGLCASGEVCAYDDQCYAEGSVPDCPDGLQGDGIVCTGSEECAVDNGGCGPAEFIVCQDNPGAAPTCTDIEECAVDNGGCGPAEFTLCGEQIAAAPTCTDVKECDLDNGGCAFACRENIGAAPDCTLCAVGYVENINSSCVWAGGLKDPGLQDSGSWTSSSQGVFVDSRGVGDMDPGEAFFSASSVCSRQMLAQTVAMPDYDDAEPLVLRVNVRNTDQQSAPPEGTAIQLFVRINGARRVAATTTSWGERSFCLGEAGYGGAVEIELGAERCDSDANMLIDHAEIFVADPGECAEHGETLNASFEDSIGWQFEMSGTSTVAAYASGAGEGSSRAGRLVTPNFCQSASMEGSLSVPSALTNPALQVWSRGRRSSRLSLDESMAYELTHSSNAPEQKTTRLCLLDSTRGSTWRLGLSLPYRSNNGGINCATTANARSLDVDQMELVSESACKETNGVIDGSFEAIAADASLKTPVDFSVSGASGISRIGNNSSFAHTGAGYIYATNKQPCASSSMSVSYTQGSGTADAGPAITYWYWATNVNAAVVVSEGGTNLSRTDKWTKRTVCLDRSAAGRIATLDFTIRSSGTCANTFASTDTIRIDDVAMTTDPSCP